MQLSAGKIGEIMDIKILVAAHKTYRMPEDDIFMPVHVRCDRKRIYRLSEGR